MLSTLTYAVRVDASPDQYRLLSDTCAAYLDCCNMVSKVAWEHRTISQKALHQPSNWVTKAGEEPILVGSSFTAGQGQAATS